MERPSPEPEKTEEPAAPVAPEPDILTMAEAAAYLRVSPQTIRRSLHRSDIPYQRVGSMFRFSRRALEAWITRASPPARPPEAGP
jgi:excisionase family DNA binding protein